MTLQETPGTKGLTAIVLEFENDPVLAAVLAQSQQEYLDSLSRGHTDSKCEYPPTSQENQNYDAFSGNSLETQHYMSKVNKKNWQINMVNVLKVDKKDTKMFRS